MTSSLGLIQDLAGTTGTEGSIGVTNPEDLLIVGEELDVLSPLAKEIVLARAAGQTLEDFLKTHEALHGQASEAWGRIDQLLARAMPGKVAGFIEDEDPIDAAALRKVEEIRIEAASRSSGHEKERPAR